MKIAAIVGSNRKESYNLKLTKFLQKRYANRFELEIVSITELPFYNQDIENTPPESVTQFKAKIKAADAVLWVVPEYNGTVPGIMVNAIDWLSRVDRVMIGKPSWIMRASMGNLGTVKASNKGIKYNRDGSLDLYVQPTPPAGHEANWLPDPPNTQFILILRMYGPGHSVLNGTYRYPTIERIS